MLSVKHYTDRMFAFRITRPPAFRFRSGEFVMIGLEGANGKPLLRAYSIASPSWDEELEFFSIKVPDGPLTSRLQAIQPGDKVLLGRKSTGTLVHDALTPGKRLYCFSTGTGLAPFASVIRDPETYERFEKIVLIHGVRNVDPELLATARSFRLPLWRRLALVVAPASMPYIFTGIRISATLSLLLTIGAELIAGVPGLGKEILLSQSVPDRMFALIIVAGLLGMLLAFAVMAIENDRS